MRLTAIAIAIVAASGSARADDLAKADELFAQGVALRESNLEQACAKFSQSLEYNRQAIGTLLNVARCHEQHGRIASAVLMFGEARDRARELHMRPQLTEAEAKIAALSPSLPHVTLTFAEPPIAGTRILLDGQVVALEATTDLPIDPGERVIVVTAPGRVAFDTRFVIARQERRAIEIPRLDAPVVSSRRTIGAITAATGAAAVITGVVLGVVANRRYHHPFDAGHCAIPDGAPRPRCDDVGLAAIESARTLGNVGTGVVIVGGVAIGVGAYLWLRASHETTRRPRIGLVPQLRGDGGGVAVVGRF